MEVRPLGRASRKSAGRPQPAAASPPHGERAALSSNMEDYLEAIFRLSAGGGDCAVRHIAQTLAVKPPSVSKAIKRLKRRGLVVQAPYGRVRVTPQGRRVALQQIRCHQALTRFLIEVLGLPEDLAEHDACLMEHAISQETAARLAEYISHLERSGGLARPFKGRQPRAVRGGEGGQVLERRWKSRV